ncbi:MAG: hypothetical protein K0Q50_389 [Vampirovibrio sp.]|jgi:hypothetical protein|nr:hypothetical protein [Vampirovibrio sp.]
MSSLESYAPLVKGKIEKLRPKLLELSTKNPLLSTKFSSRSISYVRVVDELPDVLAEKLSNGQMRVLALPAIEQDPKDEQTQVFQDALAEAMLNDSIYQAEVDELSLSDENEPQKQAELERRLKDRVREQLGLPPRITHTNVSLEQHARNNQISPHYDLPLPGAVGLKEEHQDNDIQTLMLPDSLHRHLDKISSKCEESLQETGVNILYAAFGFLEWQEQIGSKQHFAPLLLLRLTMEKVLTTKGSEFWITSNGDSVELNPVLIEKFTQEFDINLPKLEENESPEAYFSRLSDISINRQPCKVKRQIAIGIFPSTTLALYKDLDTAQLGENGFDLTEHPVLQDLFCSMDGGDSLTIYAEDYHADAPEVEAKVPLLVTQADASQYSVLADIAGGRNLSVEGPPGTGKSQTIVNAIAVALEQGKKVLFVAEKAAALEVVKNRLEAFGLGEFLLPLHSTRASKTEVVSSVKTRLEMNKEHSPLEYEQIHRSFRQARQDIAEYLHLVTQSYGNTGLTVHDIIWKHISKRHRCEALPDSVLDYPISEIETLSKTEIGEIKQLCDRFFSLWKHATSCKDYWQFSYLMDSDPMAIERTLQAAKQAGHKFEELVLVRGGLQELKLKPDSTLEQLDQLISTIDTLGKVDEPDAILMAKRLSTPESLAEVRKFLESAAVTRCSRDGLRAVLKEPNHPELASTLDRLYKLLNECNLSSLGKTEQESIISLTQASITEHKKAIQLIESIKALNTPVEGVSLQVMYTVSKILQQTPQNALELRRSELSTSMAAFNIKQGYETASLIKRKKEQTEEIFILNVLPDESVILSHIGQLSSANIFSFLKSEYRQAKHFYLTICKHKWMGNETAVLELRKLLEFLSQIKEFNNSSGLQGLLGNYFHGIDTQFEPFIAITEFYAALNQSLTGPDGVQVKDFLHNTSIDNLMLFPKPETFNRFKDETLSIGLNTFQEQLKKYEEQLKTLELNIERIQECSSVFNNPDDVIVHEIPKLIEEVTELSNAWSLLASNNTVKAILGEAFLGADTQSDDLDRALDIAETANHLDTDLRDVLLYILENGQTHTLVTLKESIAIKARDVQDSTQVLIQRANIPDVQQDAFLALYDNSSKFFEAAEDRTGLEAYRNLAWVKQELSDKGFSFLIDNLAYLSETIHGFGDITEALIYREMFRQICNQHGNFVTRYSGERLNDLRKRLADTDKELVNLARLKLRSKLIENARPPEGVCKGRKSEFTELSLLKNEAMKRARIIPVREMTRRAGQALQEIKPCWMMSPLTVAQYIPKGSIEFDLVIIDEASQMTPENAIGAICRGKQVMVVGDTNQLPPSNFFGKMFAPADGDDEDESVVDESILEMANKVFLPARRLSWHYRSRHESLIAFSNYYVYNSKLVVFPSPSLNTSLYGVSQVFVPGEYRSSINVIEAHEMVQAVLHFVKDHPDLSLGLVVMNQKQKDLIEQEWSYALDQNPQAKEYISYWSQKDGGIEKFFIKNLENVQGDERDVIFIGTVYGPEQAGGPVMQRFGPINGAAGKRRLNVLFSRAKQRIVTFTSMKPTDVIADESKPGPYMLKKWLEFSANQGNLSIGEASNRLPDSEFEECVISTIESLGCIAVPQVGVSGYFIDIGVKHPSWENDFLFGIECDGASYHSAKSARDRDRLRQEVLESKGWTLHRIWSTDWFSDPRREEFRLKQTLEKVLSEKRVSKVVTA